MDVFACQSDRLKRKSVNSYVVSLLRSWFGGDFKAKSGFLELLALSCSSVEVMSNYFNPGSPKFRRGVFLSSVYACSILAGSMLMADYGSQEHVFSPIQRYIYKKGDAIFEVKHAELYEPRTIGSAVESKPFFSMRRVDVDSDRKEIVKPK